MISRRSERLEGLLEVADDVVRMLGPDAEPDELRRHVGHAPGLLALLLVGRDGRDRGHALDPAEVGGPVDHPEAVKDLAGVLGRAVDAEAHEVAVAIDLLALA